MPAQKPSPFRCLAPRADAMKYLAAALLALLVLLQYRLWFGDGGMREVGQLRAQIETQRQENESLRERNRTLAAEVQDLKKGTIAIEERARTDLGMIGKSETFYQVVTDEKRKPAVADSEEEKSESEAADRRE
jgi:cell division protein FtsB